MRFLILLLRGFTNWFGLTEAKPYEEKKYAIFLAVFLSLLVLFMVGATMLLLYTLYGTF